MNIKILVLAGTLATLSLASQLACNAHVDLGSEDSKMENLKLEVVHEGQITESS